MGDREALTQPIKVPNYLIKTRHRVSPELTLTPIERTETDPVFPALYSYRAETDRFTALRLGGENPSRELPGFAF